MTDLETLLSKIDEAMKRDVTCILLESSRGKLSPTSARDLVQYRKLVTDAMDALETAAKALPQRSEEELRALAQELLKNRT